MYAFDWALCRAQQAGKIEPSGKAEGSKLALARRDAVSGEWHDELWLSVAKPGRYDVTGDHAHVYWFEELPEGGVRFAWDGVAGEPFDEVLPQQDGEIVVESRDRRGIAYYGRRGTDYFVGYEGEESPPYPDISRSVWPTFSADGSHFAYGAFIDGGMRLVLDGMPLREWFVAPVPPVFSGDGQRFAFVADNASVGPGEKVPGDYRQWVVLDGVAQPGGELISNVPGAILFSPDGARFAFAAVDNGLVRMVVDGAIGKPYLDLRTPMFSPDGRRFVYVAVLDKKHTTVVDNEIAGPVFEKAYVPVFSPDSRRLAYWGVTSKDRAVAVVDGRPGPEFADGWENIRFSPDSRRCAYIGLRRGSGLLGGRQRRPKAVIDGVAGIEWDEVASPPHFSPDSRHVAFSARRGKSWSMVIDDVPGPEFDMVGPPRYSSAGKLAYLVQSQASYSIVFDGVRGPSFDEPSPQSVNYGFGETWETFIFSPDGMHVAANAWLQGGWRPIVDQFVGPAYDGVGRIRFEADRFYFSAMRLDDGIHRVWLDTGV